MAVRPFRALHHLREAKILNLTTRPLETDRIDAIAARFGTQIVPVDLPRMIEAYEAVDSREAEARRGFGCAGPRGFSNRHVGDSGFLPARAGV